LEAQWQESVPPGKVSLLGLRPAPVSRRGWRGRGVVVILAVDRCLFFYFGRDDWLGGRNLVVRFDEIGTLGESDVYIDLSPPSDSISNPQLSFPSPGHLNMKQLS
jgi:hypothetical protein